MTQRFGKSSVVRGALLMMSATYIIYAIGLAINALIARAVGPVGFGNYSYLVWLSGILVIIANNGLNTTGIWAISESFGRGSEESARSVHGWLRRRQHVCLAGVALLFLAGSQFLQPAGWGDDHKTLFAILVLTSVVGKTYYLFAISAAKGYGRFDVEAFSTVGASIINIAIVLALIAADAPLIAYLITFSAISLLHIVIAAALSSRAGIRAANDAIEPVFLARVRTHLFWTVILTVVGALSNKSIEIFLLNRLVGPAEVGFFVVAATLTRGGVDLLSAGLTTVLMPTMGHAFGVAGVERVNAILSDAVRYFGFLGLVLAGSGALLAEPLIRIIYGEDYAPAIVLLQAMAVVGGVTLSEGAFGAVLSTTNNQRLRAILAAGTIVASAAFAIILVPAYGLAGAIASHVISRLVIFTIVTTVTTYTLSARMPWRALVRQLAAAIAAAIIAMALVRWIPGIAGSVLAAVAYAAALAACSIAFGAWQASDAQMVLALVRRFPRVHRCLQPLLQRWTQD